MIVKTKGEIYEEVLAEFRKSGYKNTNLDEEWVSLKDVEKVIDEFKDKDYCQDMIDYLKDRFFGKAPSDEPSKHLTNASEVTSRLGEFRKKNNKKVK